MLDVPFTRKFRTVFKAELKYARDTGKVSYSVWKLLQHMAGMVSTHTTDIEGSATVVSIRWSLDSVGLESYIAE